MVKRVKFSINAEGQVSVNVEGAVSKECEGLTAAFEEALGTVVKRDYKDSYFAETEEAQIESRREEI